MTTHAALDRRRRWSGVLIAGGLAIQFATSFGARPLAFVAFVAIACPVVAAGMGLFLWTIVSRPSPDGVQASGQSRPTVRT